MDRNFAKSLALVLKHEGGYVNHPNDPGGPTNKGITLANFRRYVKKDGTINDLKRISAEQVEAVYRKHYWDKVRGDELPDGLDYAVFDYGVNSGPSRAIKHLQEVIGVKVDGEFGPGTMKAAWNWPAGAVLKLCERRMSFLKALKTWPTFGKGWTRRVDGVREVAYQWAQDHAMDAKPAPATPTPAGIPPDGPLSGPEPVAVTPQVVVKPAPSRTGLWAMLAILASAIASYFGVK